MGLDADNFRVARHSRWKRRKSSPHGGDHTYNGAEPEKARWKSGLSGIMVTQMSPKALVRAASSLSCLLLWSCLFAQCLCAEQPQKQLPVPEVKASARDMTLGEFRNSYLNQRVLILQGHDIGGYLGGWQPVKQAKDGSFRIDFGKGAFISFRYKDQTPTIIAISQSSAGGSSKGGQTNAMGETLTDDDIVNPYVDVFVRFDDGQLAKYTSYVTLIRDRSVKNLDPDSWEMELLPVSVRDVHAEIVARNLPSVIGHKVYAVHASLLFGLDITTAELLDIGSRLIKRLQDVPLLTPMTIVAAKYNDRYDLIVWKLRLPDGREIMSAARYRDEDLSENGNDNSFLGRSIGRLLLNIPSNLTSEEVVAISGRKIFRGMSRRAVFYSWGVTTENDYGKGGTQLVYGENQFVYLDNRGKVTDWQSLDR
jgi:hypothetical protein